MKTPGSVPWTGCYRGHNLHVYLPLGIFADTWGLHILPGDYGLVDSARQCLVSPLHYVVFDYRFGLLAGTQARSE